MSEIIVLYSEWWKKMEFVYHAFRYSSSIYQKLNTGGYCKEVI